MCSFMSSQVKTVICDWLAWAIRMKRPGQENTFKDLINKATEDDNGDDVTKIDTRVPSSLSILPHMREIDHVIHSHTSYRPASERHSEFSRQPSHTNSLDAGFRTTLKGEISQILDEIRFITTKIKDDMTADDETNDWKWAAMVIDRFCLYIFSVYLVFATVIMFGKAPFIFGGDSEIGLPPEA